MVRSICIMTVLLLLACPAATSTVAIYVSADQSFFNPFIDDVPGVISLHVIVTSTVTSPVTAVRFSAPVPECFEGASWLSDTPVTAVTIGDSQTGVTVGFGQCLPSPARALTINVLAQGATEKCCLYGVLADPNAPSGEVEAVDCDNNLMTTVGGHSVVSSRLLWIGEPDPPDGAVGRPLNTKLSWGVHSCGTTVGLGVVWDELFFGLTPDPPAVSEFIMEIIPQPYDPGPLLPGKTYYWKAKRIDTDVGTIESPVWQFTTTAEVPTDHSTWGRVKSLYGD